MMIINLQNKKDNLMNKDLSQFLNINKKII